MAHRRLHRAANGAPAVRGFAMAGAQVNLEERFMGEQFGANYAQYRRHVKALIPFVWVTT
jgi:protein-S-isoprenylcysteine O-methyltransferase Ste14